MDDNALRLTGIPSIDEEHRALLHCLQDLQKENIGQEAWIACHQTLQRYAEEHFAHEESMLVACGYPEQEQHKRLHADFRDKVEALGTIIHAGESRQDDTIDQTIRDVKKQLGRTSVIPASPKIRMVAFLVQWLLQHVNGHDQAFVEHIKKHSTP